MRKPRKTAAGKPQRARRPTPALPVITIKSFKQAMDLWPSKLVLAQDLGVLQSRVEKWYFRDNIPAEFWQDMIDVAKRRKLGKLTHEGFGKLAALGRPPRLAPQAEAAA